MNMREIKFRGWNRRLKRMNCDSLQVLEVMADPQLHKETTNGEFIIMQYTGLKDKNGKEIYEGDILKYPNGEIVNVIWMVNPASFSPKEIDILHAPHIIGNIFESPSEIEEKK